MKKSQPKVKVSFVLIGDHIHPESQTVIGAACLAKSVGMDGTRVGLLTLEFTQKEIRSLLASKMLQSKR